MMRKNGRPHSDIDFGKARNLSQQRGIALAPILYVLAMIAIGGAVLVGGYTQILRSNVEATQAIMARNAMDSAMRNIAISQGSILNAAGYTPIPATTFPVGDTRVPTGAGILTSDDGLGDGGSTQGTIGIIPSSSPSSKLDPWGRYYVYCAWPRTGATAAIANLPAYIILSAGQDGKLDTTCAQAIANNGPATNTDDRAVIARVSDMTAHASLWQKDGDRATVLGSTSNPASQVRIDSTVATDGSITSQNLTVAGSISTTKTDTGVAQDASRAFLDIVSNYARVGAVAGVGQGAVAPSGIRFDVGNTNLATLDNTGLTLGNRTISSGSITSTGPISGTSLSISGVASIGTGLTITSAGLDVTGSTSLRSGLAVTGATSTTSLSTGALTASGAATLASLTVTGASALSGGATVSSGLTSDTLTVSGASTLSGSTSVGGTFAATGLSTLSGGLTVAGATSLGGTLSTTGAATFGSTVTVTGTTTTANLSATGTSSLAGVVSIAGASPAGGEVLAVGGSAVFTGAVSAPSFTGNLSGNVAGGSATFTGNVTADGLTVNAGATIGTSLSVGTGITVTNGGIGVSGLVAGGSLSISGAATMGGPLSVTSGPSTFAGLNTTTLTATGVTSLGATTANSLAVTNNATVGGTLQITGNLTALSGTTTLGALNAGATSVTSLVIGNNASTGTSLDVFANANIQGMVSGTRLRASANNALGTAMTNTDPVAIGLSTGKNLGISVDEIQARNNGAASVLYLNALGGSVSAPYGFVGSLTGNASTATALQTARNFSISGDATAPSISFNGTADVALVATVTKLQGRALASTAPTDRQVVSWDDATSTWLPRSLTGADLGGGTVGGTSDTTFLAADGTAAIPGIAFRLDTNTGLYRPGDDIIGFTTGGTERARLSGSNLLIGGTSARHNGLAQIEGTGINASVSITRNSADTGGAALYLAKTRAASIGGVTAASAGDTLGSIYFVPSNGTDFTSISASIGSTLLAGASGSPGNIVFSTTADTATAPIPRLTIQNDYSVVIGSADQASSVTGGTIRAPSGSGTNVTGGTLTIAGGASTGNASGGPIVFRTSPSGAAGTTANTLTERMRISPTGFVGIGTSSPTVSLHLGTTDAIQLPSGGDAARPGTPDAGMIRYNTTSSVVEAYVGGSWTQVLTGGGGGSGAQLALANGAAAAPSLYFATDIQLGLYRSGAGILGFAAGGAEIAQISASGFQIPRNTSATVPDAGMLRFNTTIGKVQVSDGSAWSVVGGGTQIYENDTSVTVADPTVGGTGSVTIAVDASTSVSITANATSFSTPIVLKQTAGASPNINVSPSAAGLTTNQSTVLNGLVAGNYLANPGNTSGNLTVAGSIRPGADTSSCSAANAGTIRLNGSDLQSCNGTTWGALGGSSLVGETTATITRLGNSSAVSGSASIGIGTSVNIAGAGAVGIGDSVTINATGTNSTAIGNAATIGAGFSNAVALGNQASVTASNMIQLGNSSVTLVNTSGTFKGAAFQSTSDARLETDIRPLPYGLAEILKVQPVLYRLIEGADELQIGVIAQELQKVMPELIVGIEGDISKGERLAVSYDRLAVVMAAAIKELVQHGEKQSEMIAQMRDGHSAMAKDVQTAKADVEELKSQIAKIQRGQSEKNKAWPTGGEALMVLAFIVLFGAAVYMVKRPSF